MEAPEETYHGRTDAVYHIYPDCPRGRQIPPEWRVRGPGFLPRCLMCDARLNARTEASRPG